MSSTGNEANGRQPTVEEEVAKFRTVAFKDGEIASGKATDNSDEQAAEARAGEVNRRTHAENVAAGKTGTEREAGDDKNKPAAVELSAAEEAAAIEKAEKTEGGELSDAEKEAVLASALAAKQKTAAGEARKAAKAARFNDNFRAARAAERRADALDRELRETKDRLAVLERGGKPLTNAQATGNDDEEGKPDPKNAKYEYGELDAKYLADLSRYETLKAIRDEKAKEQTTRQTKAEAEAAEAFKERVEVFAEAGLDEFDDFQEVVMDTLNLPKDDPDAWPLSPTMGELILESDHGRAIAYELASDPAEARRLIKLSTARQAIWFGQKEAELTAGSAANGKTKEKTPVAEAGGEGKTEVARESKAPRPPTKLNGAGGNRIPNDATTDFAAFEAMAMGGNKR